MPSQRSALHRSPIAVVLGFLLIAVVIAVAGIAILGGSPARGNGVVSRAGEAPVGVTPAVSSTAPPPRSRSTARRASKHPSIAAPAALRVVTSGQLGVRLRWKAVPRATSYDVVAASNPEFGLGVRMFTIKRLRSTSATVTFSPPGIPKNTTYYFKVRARGNGHRSADSGVVVAQDSASRIDVAVGSFNIRKNDSEMPWTADRQYRVRALLLNSGFDIVGLQEAPSTDNFGLMYKSLALAFRFSGVGPEKILYRSDRFVPSRGIDGTIDLGGSSASSPRTATYTLLKDIRNNAEMLVVCPHLAYEPGRQFDSLRAAETRNLVNGIHRVNTGSWPVIVPGDFNSAAVVRTGGFDGAGRVMAKSGLIDSEAVATTRTNSDFGSINGLHAKPRRSYRHIDRVFVSPEVAVANYEVLVQLTGNAKRYAKPFLSDHNAIKVNLSIPID